MAKTKPGERVLASNRRARFDYHILDTFEAGVVLRGTEVKSVREGRVVLRDCFVEIRNDEAYLIGAHIHPYTHGNRENHEPERPRKLLLHRREIDRLFGRTQMKGLSVVPLAMYLKNGRVKVEIALVRGKKQYDKREAEKRRELDREMAEAMSHRRS